MHGPTKILTINKDDTDTPIINEQRHEHKRGASPIQRPQSTQKLPQKNAGKKQQMQHNKTKLIESAGH